jgi:hypothetical protein
MPGVARDARGWHHRGARRGYAADSVHCRPYANPRVEGPRWVGLTEGAAPSACDHNDCRKGVESLRTNIHRTARARSGRDTSQTTSITVYASNSCLDLPALPTGWYAGTSRQCPSLRRWCGSGRRLSSTPGPTPIVKKPAIDTGRVRQRPYLFPLSRQHRANAATNCTVGTRSRWHYVRRPHVLVP